METAVRKSRTSNNGGFDLSTLDEIWRWGFPGQLFPLRDQSRVLEVTRGALVYLDSGDCYNACRTLMQITYQYPHPSGATKILGLSDQENYCIFDQRVGRALDSLTKDGKKIILCPSEDEIHGSLLDGWAEQYQRLIWTLSAVRHYLRRRQKDRTISQIEMALFMRARANVKSA